MACVRNITCVYKKKPHKDPRVLFPMFMIVNHFLKSFSMLLQTA